MLLAINFIEISFAVGVMAYGSVAAILKSNT
jgi:hypothetical protein